MVLRIALIGDTISHWYLSREVGVILPFGAQERLLPYQAIHGHVDALSKLAQPFIELNAATEASLPTKFEFDAGRKGILPVILDISNSGTTKFTHQLNLSGSEYPVVAQLIDTPSRTPYSTTIWYPNGYSLETLKFSTAPGRKEEYPRDDLLSTALELRIIHGIVQASHTNVLSRQLTESQQAGR